jgi:Flp pilus assembly protein TadD
MEIAGQSGVDELRRALRDHDDDLALTMALGWLYMQAEQYSAAVRTFGRLDDGDPPNVEAVLGRALAQIRMRASAPAESALENHRGALVESTRDPSARAFLDAGLGALALTEDNLAQAQREAEQALELDPKNTEAHLLLADLAEEREQDGGPELEAAMDGRHPSARPLAVLAIREEQVSDAICNYATRYRHAAPHGQYARGVARVRRDCRRRDR